LILWLAAETTLLVASAALLQFWVTSPRGRRILWQVTLMAIASVCLVEISGVRDRIPRTELPQRYIVTTTVGHSTVSDTKTSDRGTAAVAFNLESNIKWPGWVWLAACALLVGRLILARLWLATRRRGSATADASSLLLVERLKTSFGLRRVKTQVWDGLRTPVAFGIFQPTIALPPDFSRHFLPAEKEVVIAHELAHLTARDPFWLMISDAVVALAWWNPLVWWAREQLQSANESAADEASTLIPGGAHALAECLVRLGHELTAPNPVRALGIDGNSPHSQLATRIQRLLRGPQTWRRPSLWLRWAPQISAIFAGATAAILPIQTGLSGSLLVVLVTVAPARAENVALTNESSPPAVILVSPAPTMKPAPHSVAVSNPATNGAFSVTATSAAPLTYQWYFNGTNVPPVGQPKAHPIVLLLCRVLVVSEDGADDIGLDWIFGKNAADNPPLETSRDWKTLDRSAVIQPSNFVIDRLRTEGQSAILRSAQFKALCDRIRSKHLNFDSSPRIETASGVEADLSVSEANTFVTGVQATNGSPAAKASVNYLTDKINLGLSIDILPTYEEGDQWRLRVRGSKTAFLAYDQYGKDFGSVSNPGGKPMQYAIPHPHFRAVEADSDDSLKVGDTLALRGPLWTETITNKGHFFFPGKTTTVRKRLYVFVTPTTPPPKAGN
jgi:beta-lactamase regulating signal transducer with metallopeptidase domain